MVTISPISEDQASEEVKRNYREIKDSLSLPSVPLFFTYLGPFPEYLTYITKQIVENLKDNKFIDLCKETKTSSSKLIHTTLPKAEETINWISRYKYSPSFYNFQSDLHTIFLTNIKMMYIFIALREAVKGWAIAAKQLSSTVKTDRPASLDLDQSIKEDAFVYEDYTKESKIITTQSKVQSAFPVRTSQGIEKDLLPQYITLCRNEFLHLMRLDSFWTMRVGMEKLTLFSLTLFPHLIFSPINLVIEYTEKYPTFSELLYLLCEHFPTYAMHRMIFSGYLIE